MADFVEDEIIDKNVEEEEVDSEEDEKDVKGKASKSGKKSERKSDAEEPFDFTKPRKVTYCPTCSLPPEYCEYGQTFEKCLPWILENCPEAVSEDILSKMMGEVSIEGEEGVKKKNKRGGGGGAGPKKVKEIPQTKIVIARIQRQKRKYVTAVAGLDTVPELKVKDAARVFGKKFSSGSSVSESATGAKEVVIQGDVMFELPALLMSEFKIPAETIFFMDEGGGSMRPFA
mmetsp:Transcript_25215/g.24132  ORF Transcript_25215/g.24132 Transcript_25215/m.24132 type:complete len:230 (+) Transcript_25215:115-804(+)